MANHGSANMRAEKPHTINHSLRRRAQAVLNDRSIDAQTRAFVRYGLEINDPWLAELVTRAEGGENIVDTFESLRTLVPIGDESVLRKVEALAEIISRSGDEPTASLFILMETLENSTDARVLASRAKHVAFSRCGELHVYEMINAQVAELEGELLASNTLVS